MILDKELALKKLEYLKAQIEYHRFMKRCYFGLIVFCGLAIVLGVVTLSGYLGGLK